MKEVWRAAPGASTTTTVPVPLCLRAREDYCLSISTVIVTPIAVSSYLSFPSS